MKIEPLSIGLISQIRQLRRSGESIRRISAMTGVSLNSVIKYSKAAIASNVLEEKE